MQILSAKYGPGAVQKIQHGVDHNVFTKPLTQPKKLPPPSEHNLLAHTQQQTGTKNRTQHLPPHQEGHAENPPEEAIRRPISSATRFLATRERLQQPPKPVRRRKYDEGVFIPRKRRAVPRPRQTQGAMARFIKIILLSRTGEPRLCRGSRINLGDDGEWGKTTR